MTNPILEELHATRAKLLTEVDGDVHRYIDESRKRALASGRAIAEPTSRTGRLKRSVNIDLPATERPSSSHNNR